MHKYIPYLYKQPNNFLHSRILIPWIFGIQVDRQSSLHQLLLNDLPPAHGNLLVDVRDLSSYDLHVRQSDEVFLRCERLHKLAGLGPHDEVPEQCRDGVDGVDVRVQKADRGQLACALENLERYISLVSCIKDSDGDFE